MKPLLERSFDAGFFNSVMNHPDVRPHIGPGPKVLDVSAFVADANNVALANEHGGFLFHRYAPGIYEVHTQFLPSGRGKQALESAQYAAFWMFTQTDCMEILTKIQADNRPAIKLTVAMGFDFLYEHDRPEWGQVKYYRLDYHRWVNRCTYLPEKGRWFHERLEALRGFGPGHEDDAAHDRYVGATVVMIQAGNTAKAIHTYSRWAQLSGYCPLKVVGTDPLVLDVGDGLIAVENGTFTVPKE